MYLLSTTLVVLAFCALLTTTTTTTTLAFDVSSLTSIRVRHSTKLQDGKRFGKDARDREPLVDDNTYGKEAISPIRDVIDTESALREFFEGYGSNWRPLFRSMLTSADDDVAAMSWLQDMEVTDFVFGENSDPWRRLEAIPTSDGDRTVLGEFLDQVQASLIDIPVDETTEDDANDLHFLEEGRRMLVCSRFHVVSGGIDGVDASPRIESFEELFSTCWNELYHLFDEDEADTGSLIVVPGSNLDDLRRFVDMNLQRPLQAMGLEQIFEVASMTRGYPAIRVIHKLSEIPTDLEEGPQQMGEVPEISDENS